MRLSVGIVWSITRMDYRRRGSEMMKKLEDFASSHGGEKHWHNRTGRARDGRDWWTRRWAVLIS
jgi:hypothetical protein